MSKLIAATLLSVLARLRSSLFEIDTVVVDPQGSGGGEGRGWPEVEQAERGELEEEPDLC
jgi:hypothetical protein